MTHQPTPRLPLLLPKKLPFSEGCFVVELMSIPRGGNRRKAHQGKGVPCHILHGRLSRKQRVLALEALKAMPDATARVILATGRLIGEGFDHSPLNTMVVAMPISWQGTLQQYAGRLHREHIDKTDIRIYDYVEIDNPQLHRMWKKRRAGYVAMGYQIIEGE